MKFTIQYDINHSKVQQYRLASGAELYDTI